MKSKFCPTEAYAKDTGLVVVLILLLATYWRGNSFLIVLAIVTLVVTMTIPMVLTPLAVIWYYFSKALGYITNRIILTVIFGVVLTPMGMIRRLLGYDPMKRKAWKNGSCSVFIERNHIFTANDFNRPY